MVHFVNEPSSGVLVSMMLTAAGSAAQVGATASGRSAYVPSAHLLGVTDPGAEAIAVILGAMAAA